MRADRMYYALLEDGTVKEMVSSENRMFSDGHCFYKKLINIDGVVVRSKDFTIKKIIARSFSIKYLEMAWKNYCNKKCIKYDWED